MSRSAARTLVLQVFSYLFLIGLAVAILYPLSITVISAFKPGNLIAFRLEWSDQWTLANFARLFAETPYLLWYRNTLVIALATMALQVTVVSLAGYAFSRFRFAGRSQALKFFLLAQMIPTTAAFAAFYVMALLVHGLDQYWFLTLAYVGGGIPMNTWLMKGYFDTVPVSLDEAALLDGASRLRTFWQIVLPLVRPMLAIQALWAFMTPFGEYMLARFLLRSPDALTIAVGLQSFVADPRTQKLALFAAGAILAALPIVVMFFFLQKGFVRGLTAGASRE